MVQYVPDAPVLRDLQPILSDSYSVLLGGPLCVMIFRFMLFLQRQVDFFDSRPTSEGKTGFVAFPC